MSADSTEEILFDPVIPYNLYSRFESEVTSSSAAFQIGEQLVVSYPPGTGGSESLKLKIVSISSSVITLL